MLLIAVESLVASLLEDFNMATGRIEKTWRSSLCCLLSVITVLNQICLSVEDGRQMLGKSVEDTGGLNVKNLDGTTDRRTFVDDVYVTDNKQDPVSPEMLGGIIIQHESQKLSARLRWLSNDEIGITNMQVRYELLRHSAWSGRPVLTDLPSYWWVHQDHHHCVLTNVQRLFFFFFFLFFILSFKSHCLYRVYTCSGYYGLSPKELS